MSVECQFSPTEYSDAGWAESIPDLHKSSWAKRREWLHVGAHDARLTAGSKTLLNLLAARSDDAGKPVWGSQSRIAAILGVSVRSVVRYVAELASHGYVRVFGSLPSRSADGRWHRRKSNIYYLTVPTKESRSEAPWRRRRRERSTMPTDSAQSSTSRLEDSSVTSTPERVAQPSPPPAISLPPTPSETAAPFVRLPDAVAEERFASMRRLLAGARADKRL